MDDEGSLTRRGASRKAFAGALGLAGLGVASARGATSGDTSVEAKIRALQSDNAAMRATLIALQADVEALRSILAANHIHKNGKHAIPSPGDWSLVAPVPPITTISNPGGVGLNVNNVSRGAYHDTVITNTPDSGVLLQGSTIACTFRRIRVNGCDDRENVDYGAHGVYCLARNNTFVDISIDGTGHGSHAGSGFSVRMGGNTFTRTLVKAMPFAASYFEEDEGGTAPVRFINGEWHFENDDTAVWMDRYDIGTAPISKPFVFRNISAYGPGRHFLKIAPSAYAGPGVVIDTCRLNGARVTAAMIDGVPSNLLTVK